MSEKVNLGNERQEDNPWDVVSKLTTVGKNEQVHDITVRELSPEDDFGRAAELVFQVDPYICPDFFGDAERAKVIGDVLFSDDGGLFDSRHTIVAEVDGILKGILIYADNKITPWDCDKVKKKIEGLGIEMPENFDRANKYYMEAVANDAMALPDGVAEVEFCSVEAKHRDGGIGQKLFDEFLKKQEYQEQHLTVLADNPRAIHVYQKKGFEIVRETTGYPDDSVKTFNMIRKS